MKPIERPRTKRPLMVPMFTYSSASSLVDQMETFMILMTQTYHHNRSFCQWRLMNIYLFFFNVDIISIKQKSIKREKPRKKEEKSDIERRWKGEITWGKGKGRRGSSSSSKWKRRKERKKQLEKEN